MPHKGHVFLNSHGQPYQDTRLGKQVEQALAQVQKHADILQGEAARQAALRAAWQRSR